MSYLIECTSCKVDHKLQHMDWESLVCVECGFDMPNTLPDMYRNYINLQYQDGLWYYIGNKDGARRTLEAHIRKNKNRMFIGGSYIKKDSPLHSPGNYDDYADLAFSKLRSETKVTEGQIYLISNPAWKGWLKLGRAISAKDRLSNFQTASPYRDYKVEFAVDVPDAQASEVLIQNLLRKKCTKKNEWFNIEITNAIEVIEEAVHYE